MKILLVSSFFPYPLFSGGQVRLYNLIRTLGKKHQITLICETRKPLTTEETDALKKYCYKIKTVIRPKQWSIKNIIRTGFSLYPFLLVGHQNRQMKHILKQELEKEKYEIIHVETFYVMQNLPPTSIPTVLVEHNIEYDVYQRWVNNFKLFVFKPILFLDILKIKYWENYYWKKADLVVAVSEEEKNIIENATGKTVEVVPNGVDVDYFADIQRTEPLIPTIVFVGSFKWIQNIDACNFLLKKLWPQIKTLYGQEIRLRLVGNCIIEKIGKIKDKDVIVEESVKDIRQVYSSSTVLLAPIRIGGGTKFKILESLASGLPIVTTKKGVEGLGQDTNGIVVCDEEADLVKQTVKILSLGSKRGEVSRKERIFVKKNFDWTHIADHLNYIYQKVANRK